MPKEPWIATNNFKQAIALDPSDSWSYAYLALAQVCTGRSPEAIKQIRTAMRLDPNYPPVFVYILGVVQLSLAQFEEAAASLERAARLNPEDEYSFLALAATYGYLGREPEAMAAVARYNEIRIGRGDLPLTVAGAPSLTFSTYLPNTLVKKGLRLVGVPEKLEGSAFAAKNQLGAGETRDLFFGHRLRGRSFESGDEHGAAFQADGRATLSGDWGSVVDAAVSLEGDKACFAGAGGVRFCASVLRNPGGSNFRQNEYIWLDATGAYSFSQVQ